jgi:hypothetical protein
MREAPQDGGLADAFDSTRDNRAESPVTKRDLSGL